MMYVVVYCGRQAKQETSLFSQKFFFFKVRLLSTVDWLFQNSGFVQDVPCDDSVLTSPFLYQLSSSGTSSEGIPKKQPVLSTMFAQGKPKK